MNAMHLRSQREMIRTAFSLARSLAFVAQMVDPQLARIAGLE